MERACLEGSEVLVKMPCSEDDDSQTGYGESQGLSKAELRKTNKPIMEKKRRARINNCLNELKDLLVDTSDKDPARHSKLEKADILELAVKHLQKLQRQQLAAAIAADPAVLQRFKSGFGDCAVEVRRYLSRLASVPTGLRHRIGTHLNTCISGIVHPPDYQPLIPDPLRLDDERPSAFHYVKATKPTSPLLSPMSCDSACDSSTEMETPPRPVNTFPFPTPPSGPASDQDSSPEQKPTVSSTTISPDTKQDGRYKVMEPLSIVIDVENYKIGIDASPKRAVDYSMRQKLKRPLEPTGHVPKMMRLEPERCQEQYVEKPSAFRRVMERPVYSDRRLTIPSSIPSILSLDRPLPPPERLPPQEKPLSLERPFPPPDRLPSQDKPLPLERPLPQERPVQRSVISHTAESLAQSTSKSEKARSDRAKSPEQGPSNSEMWRPW